MQDELAQYTLTTVNRALRSGQIASMPELVRIIRVLAQDEGSVSISELAEIINQDATILARVIAAANTFGYNPTGMEIASVADAIHTIGFNRVRMLAMSLMLLDHADRTNSAAEQKHMAAVSVTSGLIAQAMAENAGFISPETAFVCASLRNFGRLLLGTFMVDEFREALVAADRGEGENAFVRIFGLSPFHLSYELLKSSNLPGSILHAVHEQEFPAEAEIAWSDRMLHKVSRFSLRFSELALDSDLDDLAFDQQQQDLVHQAGHDFPFLIERAPNILKEAEQRLALLISDAGPKTVSTMVRDRLLHRAKATPLDGQPEAPELTPPSYFPPDAEIAATALDDEIEDAVAATALPPRLVPDSAPEPAPVAVTAIDQAMAALADNLSDDTNPLPMALNAVWKTLQPQDLFFCAPDRHSHTFHIVIGKGPLADQLGERTLFRRDDRNAFSLCHERLINLAVQDTSDPRIHRHLPDWIKTPEAPKAFLAVPVHHQRTLQGILVLGWPQVRANPFSSEELTPIQSLFALVASYEQRQRKTSRLSHVA